MIYYRKYPTYEAYVYKQGAKARGQCDKVLAGSPGRFATFRLRFKKFSPVMLSGKVLCLGARTGCEVKAAIRSGFANSIGVDLYPIGDLVIQGDWHNLPFEDVSFENVYSNSLDHCMDLTKLSLEVKRVLVPNGRFIYESHTHYALDSRLPDDPIDIEEAMRDNSNRNPINAMWWDSLKDIADEFVKIGFEIIQFYDMRKFSAYVLRKL
jgi:SAM-dependent methyltransferase